MTELLAPLTDGIPVSLQPAALYLQSLKPGGRRGIVDRMIWIAKTVGAAHVNDVPWDKLRYRDIRSLLTAAEHHGFAPATINLTLAALRGIAREGFKLGLMSADDWLKIRELKPARQRREPAGRCLSTDEIQRLLDACRTPRERAIFLALYQAGMRRAEVSAMSWEDCHWDESLLTVHGKGDSERIVPMTVQLRSALVVYRAHLPPDRQIGWVFRRVFNGEEDSLYPRLTPGGIAGIVAALALRAEVLHLSPHDLRRTFVTNLLDSAHVTTVASLAGHSSTDMTARYDRRLRARQIEAIRTLEIGDVRA